MNGEIVARAKTARGFNLAPDPERDRLLGGGCPALVRMYIVHHNFFRPHSGLGGKTPAEAAGVSMGGDDKTRHDDMERRGKGRGGRQGRRA